MIKNIVIFGSGNVATQIAKQLHANSINILQVYSKTLNNAQLLANSIKTKATDDIKAIIQDADLYLVCLNDSAIEITIGNLCFEPKLIAHTAGSVPLKTLNKFKNFGVFYPLQTFTKSRKINLRNVPFCIEANTNENEKILFELAKILSSNVKIITTEQRKKYHLAAVFANNFANHMFAAAKSLLDSNHLDFELLKPLIHETALKIQDMAPELAQTGPAVRNNKTIIESHKQQISSPELEKLYSFVSESIFAFYNNKNGLT